MREKCSRPTAARDRGFTLVELLVTISIIGILTSIAAFGVQGLRSRSVKQACVTDLRSAQTALDSYRTRFGEYAPLQSNLEAGGVIRQLSSNSDYSITYTRVGTSYKLTVIRKGVSSDVVPADSRSTMENACK